MSEILHSLLISLGVYFSEKVRLVEAMTSFETLERWDKNLVLEALIENFIDDVKMWDFTPHEKHVEGLLREALFDKFRS